MGMKLFSRLPSLRTTIAFEGPPRLHTAAAANQLIPSNPFRSLFDSPANQKSIEKTHAVIVVHGLAKALPFQTKLLSSYGSSGDVESARMVFDRIQLPDLYSWKVMLRWYYINEQYAEAIGFYGQTRWLVGEVDNIAYSLLFKACIKLLDLDEGKKLHSCITKSGAPDSFLLNVLINMYAKCGDIGYARMMFDEIPERNVISWTSLMSGYIQHDQPDQGLVLFNQMRKAGVEPSEHTIGSLLSGCTMLDALHQGKWIHGYTMKGGFLTNSFIATAIFNMYVKCGEVTDARSIFDGLCIVDLVSWTAMIVGYTQKGLPVEALKLFSDVKFAHVVPNSVTVSSSLSASTQLRDLGLGQSVHVLGIKLGFDCYAVVMNSLVDMYAKCNATRDATYIFKGISQKDIVSYNAMIAGFSQNELGFEALLLINQMRSDGCLPDAITVVSALSACACFGAPIHGNSFHCYAIKAAFIANVYVGTALVNLYNKFGDLISARRVFDEIRGRSTVTWCAMMGGCGMQGDSLGSLDLFSEMLKEELQPNDAIFTNILSSCSHNGMVDEGMRYFNSMYERYNIVPSMKHYACMVDMLARAGELDEALGFIERMPIKADVSVWGALLHGCKLHSRLEVGEVAARRIMELRPNTSDYYVMMSNLYASDGRWSEAVRVRESMKDKGLIKLPGCSFL